MNTEPAIISLTEKSISSAIKLSTIFENCTIFVMKKHKSHLKDENLSNKTYGKISYYEKLSNLINEIFYKYDYIIFIMATGIVIRSIAKYIYDKAKDPAIIVCDEKLKFSISLLSGHIGGANKMCLYISSKLHNTPVITTATDVNEKSALDTLSCDLGAFENSHRDLYKKINYMLANDEKVYLISDIKLPSNTDLRGFTLLKNDISAQKLQCKSEGLPIIHISYKQNTGFEHIQNYHKIVPKVIGLGMGCRKNIDFKTVSDTLDEYLKDNNIDKKSINTIASIDLKKDEQAIIQLSQSLNAKFITFSANEIKNSPYYEDIQENSFVKNITGVNSVSLACAKIISKNILIGKNFKGNKLTIATGLMIKD